MIDSYSSNVRYLGNLLKTQLSIGKNGDSSNIENAPISAPAQELLTSIGSLDKKVQAAFTKVTGSDDNQLETDFQFIEKYTQDRLKERFNEMRESLMSDLATRGLDKSSYAAQMNSALMREYLRAVEDNNYKLILNKNSLAREMLNNRLTEFSANLQSIQAQKELAGEKYDVSMKKIIDPINLSQKAAETMHAPIEYEDKLGLAANSEAVLFQGGQLNLQNTDLFNRNQFEK